MRVIAAKMDQAISGVLITDHGTLTVVVRDDLDPATTEDVVDRLCDQHTEITGEQRCSWDSEQRGVG